MKQPVGRLRLGTAVWLGMILAGSCLGAFVLATWPESTTRVTRLPYGESRPKTPSVVAKRQAPVKRVVASVGVVKPAQPQAAPEEETVERELAGPPPVPSESESKGYRPETPEELGAEPLPGMHPRVPQPADSPAPEVASTP
jgi:hypothetical protein